MASNFISETENIVNKTISSVINWYGNLVRAKAPDTDFALDERLTY